MLMTIFPKPKELPEQPRQLRADPRLAAAIGLQEAIVLTRLLEWQRYNAAMHKHQTHYRAEKWYTYNSLDEWVKDFRCFKATTLGRYLRNLEKLKLVESAQFYKQRGDVRKWYHVDEDAVFNLMNHDSILAIPSCQNDKMVMPKRHDESSIDSQQPSPNRKKVQKHHHHQDARAKVVAASADGDDFTTPDSGEEDLPREKPATQRFEEIRHEASAPQDAPSPSSAAPLPPVALKLVAAGLDVADWRAHVEQYGESRCERAAVGAMGWRNPAVGFMLMLKQGKYAEDAGDHVPGIAGDIDDFVKR